jgi:hypothetical protein
MSTPARALRQAITGWDPARPSRANNRGEGGLGGSVQAATAMHRYPGSDPDACNAGSAVGVSPLARAPPPGAAPHERGVSVDVRPALAARSRSGARSDWRVYQSPQAGLTTSLPVSPGVIRSFAGHRWQQGGNTPPCTNRKTLGGESAEIGLYWALSATDRNQSQTPRRPRNEGVRGSSPRVDS